MVKVSSLHQFLKAGTQDLHQGVENDSLLARVFAEDFSAEEYRLILEKLYQIHQSLEAQLQQVRDLDPWFEDLSDRWKIPSLRQDLEDAGNVNLLSFQMGEMSVSKAMGMMYVLEGSTLGGQVIQRKLQQNPRLKGLTFHYYSHYGSRTGEYWKRFLSVLEKFSQHPDANPEECLHAARTVFQWMGEHFKVPSQHFSCD